MFSLCFIPLCFLFFSYFHSCKGTSRAVLKFGRDWRRKARVISAVLGRVCEGSSLPQHRLCESHKHRLKHYHFVPDCCSPPLVLKLQGPHSFTHHFVLVLTWKCCRMSWISIHSWVLPDLKNVEPFGWRRRWKRHSTTPPSYKILPPKMSEYLNWI